MSNYFTYLPNVYVGKEEYNGKFGYQLTKNIFRRVFIDSTIEKYITAFESFYISDGMRPDMVAYRMYGDSKLDWLVLLTNNIIDIYTEWPKSTSELNQYINNKYENPDAIHHWETNKIMDGDNVIVQEGIEVTENFRVTMPDGTTKSKNESIYPVSFTEHETYLNEKKRIISLPIPGIIDTIVEQFEDLVAYKPHAEIDLEGNKKSPNSTTSKYFNAKSYKTKSNTGSALGSAVTSFDYGPTIASSTASAETAAAAAVDAAQNTAASAGVSATITSSTTSSGGSGSTGY